MTTERAGDPPYVLDPTSGPPSARRDGAGPPAHSPAARPPSSPAQRSETATCSRLSNASCMPASIPESMMASRVALLGAATRRVNVVRPSASVKVAVLTVVPSSSDALRQPFEGLGRDQPLVQDDLVVLAVEADLHPPWRSSRSATCLDHAGRSRPRSSRRGSRATGLASSGVVNAL